MPTPGALVLTSRKPRPVGYAAQGVFAPVGYDSTMWTWFSNRRSFLLASRAMPFDGPCLRKPTGRSRSQVLIGVSRSIPYLLLMNSRKDL